MCRTMKELERVVADYRSMKAMKEQIDAEVKSLEYEIIGYMDANEKLTETGNDFTIKLSVVLEFGDNNMKLDVTENCTCNEYEMTVVYNETTITINWEEDYI